MKILIEDAVIFLMCFYLVTSVVFAADIFNTTFPNQRWNSTTNSLEVYDPPYTPSMFGDMTTFNDTLAQYGLNNQTAGGAMNLLNPIGVVAMLQYYIGFITAVITSGLLHQVLVPFIGEGFASIISFMLNLSFVIVSIRIISGRLRWN
jgi:hypothetical protein